MTPVLESERLRLRAHTQADFPASAAMWAHPDVTRYIGKQASSQSQSWSRLLTYVGHWALIGFGYWVVEEKATGTFVGEVGFADFKREIEPSIEGLPEAGWVLTPSMHGKGYATEAVRTALAWGGKHCTQKRAVCIIDPANEASLLVAMKCQFREVGLTSFKGQPTVLLERPF